MEPASTIIKRLGGPSKVAKVVGVHRTRVSNWMRPRSVGGADGVVPFRHVPRLIEHAKSIGVSLSADDFLPCQQESAA